MIPVQKESLSSYYRQFSRQRYNKYRHQYPSMRESDIVIKIINQWEKMGTPKKKTLCQRYDATKSIKDEDERLFTTAYKTDKPAPPSPTPYSKVNPPKVTVYPPLFPHKKEDDLDSDFHRNSEHLSEEQKSDRSSYSILLRQREGKSNSNYQYINFYKYHYARLMHEHPKWSSAQISQIIKLKWKKELKIHKEKKITKFIRSPRIVKPISGQRLFRRLHRFQTYRDCKQAWKRLPFESKTRYNRWSNGKSESSINKTEEYVLKLEGSSVERILRKK